MRPRSPRLEAILSLLAPCRSLIDVGTDHGLIPLSVIGRGIAQRAIASDLRAAPLRAAQARIRAARATDRIELVRQDGLSAMAPGSVDAVVMAGMSGELIVRLCEASAHVLAGVSQLVLQPNSDAHAVRSWALRRGLRLADEQMLVSGKQFFVTCAFHRALEPDAAYTVPGFSEASLCLVGPHLLARRDAAARDYYAWQSARLTALSASGAEGVQAELSVWQAAHAYVLQAKAARST